MVICLKHIHFLGVSHCQRPANLLIVNLEGIFANAKGVGVKSEGVFVVCCLVSVVSKPSLMQYACTVGAISAKVMVNANVVILFIDI